MKLLEPTWKTRVAPMRIFTAPLNSEVEVARNVHDLVRVLGGKGKAAVKIDGIRTTEVGLCPELYNPGEDYFYVRKLDDGKCPAPPADVMIENADKLMAAGVLPSGAGAAAAAVAADAAAAAADAPAAE